MDGFLRALCILLVGTLFLGAAHEAYADEKAGSSALYPILADGKWGFISESGEVIAEPKYDKLKGFRSPYPGCAELRFDPTVFDTKEPLAVSRGGKWGFLGAEGEVISPTYSEVYGFRDGVAAVARGGKWGFIDVTGAEIIPLKYDYVSGFRDGVSAVLVDGRWGLIDREARYVVEPQYDVMRFLTYGPYVMFETKGKQGVMDVSGRVLAPAEFNYVYVLSEGLINVTVDGKGGYYNVETQTFEIKPKFDLAAPFVDGFAQVRIDGLIGFIDRNGDFTFEPKKSDKSPFASFLAYEFSSSEGNPIYRYQVRREEELKWGLIDLRDGTVLVKPELDRIEQVIEGRAVFWEGGKAGYLDAGGNVVIPAKFELAFDFSGGLAYVRFTDGSGYIDADGEMKIKFDDATVRGGPFRPNLAFVYDGNGRERYIDRDGRDVYSFTSGCELPGQIEIVEEEFPPCIPLNETLSICTDVEGVGVSFIDATPTVVMGSVFLQDRDDHSYGWYVEWDSDATFGEYAAESAQSFLESTPGYQLKNPEELVAEGFAGLRYDFLPMSGEDDTPKKSILFLNADGAFLLIIGETDSDIGLEELHEGAIEAARMVKIGE